MCLFLWSKHDVQVLFVFLELHDPHLINYNVHRENISNCIRWMCRITHRIKLHISNLLFWVHDNLYESEKFRHDVGGNVHRNLAHRHPVDLNGNKNQVTRHTCSRSPLRCGHTKTYIKTGHTLITLSGFKRKEDVQTHSGKKNTHEEVAAGCELSSKIKRIKKNS